MEQTPAPEMQNPSSPTSQVGYSQRPANARTQTYNRYLDAVWAWGNWASTITIWVWEQSGKLNRWTKTSWTSVKIPIQWTYMVTIEWVMDWWTSCKWLRVYRWQNGTTQYEAVTSMVSAFYDSLYVTRTDVVNLLKWDVITIWASLTAGSALWLHWYIKIVKLS